MRLALPRYACCAREHVCDLSAACSLIARCTTYVERRLGVAQYVLLARRRPPSGSPPVQLLPPSLAQRYIFSFNYRRTPALPGLAVLVLVVAVVLATLGLVTCVVSHYRTTGGGLGGRARSWHKSEPPPPAPAGPPVPPPAPMVVGMERLSRELRDRQVRLHSVSTDLELGLPPNIALPDGEELPYGSSTRLKIRDPEQESEIYQKCIRPPPNRTVFDGESPPPYRSSSTGLLGGGGDWASTHVVRCHSLSSAGLPCTTPAVVVPSTASAVATRARRLSAFSDSPVPVAVSDLTLVPCRTEGRRTPPGGPAQ
ncbi:protein TMEPAI-like isoform X2 [Schistocerca cancellata]|uniref:protein TMEPAI-like isoform X2 n=1 Tax=Schistocerca cancellata TaxID=274614 RepID=UPI00211764E7|nr:protein TMEPAI-like isoform X2 [Schistocerca cancellata]